MADEPTSAAVSPPGSWLCLSCGYDLARLVGTDVGVCPECSAAIDWDAIGRRSRKRAVWRPAIRQFVLMGSAFVFCVLALAAYVFVPPSIVGRARDALDGIVLIIPILFSPTLAIGAGAVFVGVHARRRRPVGSRRAWFSWSVAGLVALFWIGLGLSALIAMF